jgi:hypothetical protein
MPDPTGPDLLEQIAGQHVPEERASSLLKSRLYSALVECQAAAGPLRSLSQPCATGGLCVFEKLVAIAPVGDAMKSRNPCRVCHARVLGENVEHAPIYWPNCPYVRFQDR